MLLQFSQPTSVFLIPTSRGLEFTLLTIVSFLCKDYVNVNPNAKETIVMVHGWPGLWSNWGDQILEFQASICFDDSSYTIMVKDKAKSVYLPGRIPPYCNGPKRLRVFHASR